MSTSIQFNTRVRVISDSKGKENRSCRLVELLNLLNIQENLN